MIQKQTQEEMFALTPYDLRDVKLALKTKLKQKLHKYDNSISGVPIKIQNIKKLSDKGEIIDGDFHIYTLVSYKIKFLKLEEGQTLKGKVTHQFNSHLSLLVYGLFHVLISNENVNQIIFKTNDDGEWVCQRTNKIIQSDDEIQFTIKQIDFQENGDFKIIGEINSAKHTGLLENIKNKYQIQEEESVLEQLQNFNYVL